MTQIGVVKGSPNQSELLLGFRALYSSGSQTTLILVTNVALLLLFYFPAFLDPRVRSITFVSG